MAFKILLSSNIFARYFWDMCSTFFLISLYKGGTSCFPFWIVSSDSFLKCFSGNINWRFCYVVRAGGEVRGDTSTFEKDDLTDSPAHIRGMWEVMFSTLHSGSKTSLPTGLEKILLQSWATILEQWRKKPAILTKCINRTPDHWWHLVPKTFFQTASANLEN